MNQISQKFDPKIVTCLIVVRSEQQTWIFKKLMDAFDQELSYSYVSQSSKIVRKLFDH